MVAFGTMTSAANGTLGAKAWRLMLALGDVIGHTVPGVRPWRVRLAAGTTTVAAAIV